MVVVVLDRFPKNENSSPRSIFLLLLLLLRGITCLQLLRTRVGTVGKINVLKLWYVSEMIEHVGATSGKLLAWNWGDVKCEHGLVI